MSRHATLPGIPGPADLYESLPPTLNPRLSKARQDGILLAALRDWQKQPLVSKARFEYWNADFPIVLEAEPHYLERASCQIVLLEIQGVQPIPWQENHANS